MRVSYGFEEAGTILRPVVTVGSYDGVHRGHREILSHIRRIAAERGGESVVVTFYPHPRLVLGGEPVELLNSLEEKLALLEGIGIDHTVVVRFTEEFSRMSFREFVRDCLVGKLHLDTLMVGFNHHLGHNREGDSHKLLSMGEEFGFRLREMPRQTVDGEKVSSTVVRGLVRSGAMERAADYLGAPYFILGQVDRQGTVGIGDPAKLLPPPGIYPVDVSVWGPDGFSAEDAAAGRKGGLSQLRIGAERNVSLSDAALWGKAGNVAIKFV